MEGEHECIKAVSGFQGGSRQESITLLGYMNSYQRENTARVYVYRYILPWSEAPLYNVHGAYTHNLK